MLAKRFGSAPLLACGMLKPNPPVKKVIEILKMLWGPRGCVNKPDPTTRYRPEVNFSKEQAAINIQKLRNSF